MIQIEQVDFTVRFVRGDEHVREECGADAECSFGEAELEFVAERELVGIHEAAVGTLVDPAVAVVACSKGGVVEGEVNCHEGAEGERFDEGEFGSVRGWKKAVSGVAQGCVGVW
jgi:hypothetical protein